MNNIYKKTPTSEREAQDLYADFRMEFFMTEEEWEEYEYEYNLYLDNYEYGHTLYDAVVDIFELGHTRDDGFRWC
jgi:hypothetical protein